MMVLILNLIILSTAGGLAAAVVAIVYATRENNSYKVFAEKQGYQFDKAQGSSGYVHHSSANTQRVSNLDLKDNPYVKKYANFKTYPFGRGANKKVLNVISGTYLGEQFCAYTYDFIGSSIEKTGPGGVFSIVMIPTVKAISTNLSNVFHEMG